MRAGIDLCEIRKNGHVKRLHKDPNLSHVPKTLEEMLPLLGNCLDRLGGLPQLRFDPLPPLTDSSVLFLSTVVVLFVT